MKALPLWQPWATLVALGAKRIETRSWAAPSNLWGEHIAIHACKGGLGTHDLLEQCRADEFEKALRAGGYLVGGNESDHRAEVDALPRGAIVCTVRLVRCTEITQASARELFRTNYAECCFGDYRAGRYAWVLDQPAGFPRPIPCQGHQGIFAVPESVINEIAVARGAG